MLELTILTKGGLVLWQSTNTANEPVNTLIRTVLLEERSRTDVYTIDNYSLKWAFANEVGLVFVLIYPKSLSPSYLDELLQTVKRLFLKKFLDNNVDHDYSPFDPIYPKILENLEEKYSKPQKRTPRSFEETKKYKETLKGSKVTPEISKDKEQLKQLEEDEIAKNIKALKLQSSPRGKSRGTSRTVPGRSPNMNNDTEKKKSQKQARVWDGQVSVEESHALDYSSSKTDEENETGPETVAAQFVDESKRGRKNAKGIYEVQDVTVEAEEDDDEFDYVDESNSDQKQQGGMFSFFKSFSGQRELTAEMLDPVLATMKEHLIQKNVAAEIANDLCESVKSSLKGKKLGSFERVSTVVKASMESALTRILTPKTSLDILRDIEAAKKEGKPYTIAFIGVNGVGKSTNLSKVCFWLLQNNYNILIAACDTFRSGAVEQLRVHARNLRLLQTSGGGSVELYERGYGKDAASIAKDAISHAAKEKLDVVLIDTAGRMQDNEPLMRSLSKLVSVNNPDKIIFVGEALVGNEAVDQLTKFNQALKDFSGQQDPRQIDGMILTKFDTIDDKVGAALSMTYVTGQPIYFVGTGQTYTDLKNLRVSHVVQSLLHK